MFKFKLFFFVPFVGCSIVRGVSVMFMLEMAANGGVRLVADAALTPDDFRAVAEELKVPAASARKTGLVAAHPAQTQQTVETHWNGKETQAVAEVGDLIVTTLADDGLALRDAAGGINCYVIKQAKFAQLYASTGRHSAFGEVYAATGQVEALFLPGGFEIVAPWGEVQRGDAGYLILNGADVYGNHRDVFEAAYKTS
jgi:hypothetical protein